MLTTKLKSELKEPLQRCDMSIPVSLIYQWRIYRWGISCWVPWGAGICCIPGPGMVCGGIKCCPVSSWCWGVIRKPGFACWKCWSCCNCWGCIPDCIWAWYGVNWPIAPAGGIPADWRCRNWVWRFTAAMALGLLCIAEKFPPGGMPFITGPGRECCKGIWAEKFAPCGKCGGFCIIGTKAGCWEACCITILWGGPWLGAGLGPPAAIDCWDAAIQAAGRILTEPKEKKLWSNLKKPEKQVATLVLHQDHKDNRCMKTKFEQLGERSRWASG